MTFRRPSRSFRKRSRQFAATACSTAARSSWWRSPAGRTRWRSSTSSESSPLGSICVLPSGTSITVSGPRPTRTPISPARWRSGSGSPFTSSGSPPRHGPPWEGLEAEARHVRFAALEARARAIGADRIAMGHTADDQAETVLMRLLDGAGPRGLSGIAAVARTVDPPPDREPPRRRPGTPRRPRPRVGRGRQQSRPAVLAQPHPPRGAAVSAPSASVREITESLCRSAALSRALVDDLEQRARAELGRLGVRGASASCSKSPTCAVCPASWPPRFCSGGRRSRGRAAAPRCRAPRGPTADLRADVAPRRQDGPARHRAERPVAQGGTARTPPARPTALRRAGHARPRGARPQARGALLRSPRWTTRRRASGTVWRSTPMRLPDELHRASAPAR